MDSSIQSFIVRGFYFLVGLLPFERLFKSMLTESYQKWPILEGLVKEFNLTQEQGPSSSSFIFIIPL